jgi:hypothetical protein
VKDTIKRRSAAEEIINIFQEHFASLPAKEKKKREKAFDAALTKSADSRAKSATHAS